MVHAWVGTVHAWGPIVHTGRGVCPPACPRGWWGCPRGVGRGGLVRVFGFVVGDVAARPPKARGSATQGPRLRRPRPEARGPRPKARGQGPRPEARGPRPEARSWPAAAQLVCLLPTRPCSVSQRPLRLSDMCGGLGSHENRGFAALKRRPSRSSRSRDRLDSMPDLASQSRGAYLPRDRAKTGHDGVDGWPP